MSRNVQEKKHSKWLVMTYLAGDNNLSPYCIAFLQDLEAAEYPDDLRVVAAFDSPTPWSKGARYLEVKRGQDPTRPHKQMKWALHNDLVRPDHFVVSPDFCEQVAPTKDPDEDIAEEALARFLDWVQKYYSADKYILILYGHGPLVAGNTFLSDSNPPSYLKLGTFQKILQDHFEPKIDILACDNCVMNGIETAVQLQPKVDYMLGSQGSMLVNGWPIRKIVEVVGENCASTDPVTVKKIAEKILRVCARNLLDFALMENSSEQAVIDLTKFKNTDQIVTAVRALSAKLQCGLQFKPGTDDRELLYPVVRDLVRLARLEAQSYWFETYVDLYDFAALLLERCDEYVRTVNGMVKSLVPYAVAELESRNRTVKDLISSWPLIPMLEEIAFWCRRITDIFHYEKIVPASYYICPQLQYSHGVSIYFPWTLPEGPITFEPKVAENRTNSGQANAADPQPRSYFLRTPFQEYETYLFGQPEYADWTRFLKTFFRATLRNVRVVEFEFINDPPKIYRKLNFFRRERQAPVIDLLKSGSRNAEYDEFSFTIKNYPRRFYISPGDCKRRMDIFGLPDGPEQRDDQTMDSAGKVSYLGWNIRGLLAEEVDLPPFIPPPNEDQ
jgi:Clostripain family